MKNKINILLFLVWIAVVLVAAFNHEIWRDEAQVWCIVRDLGFLDIFETVRVDGHPLLWYLLVLPFAKLGMPVESMMFISILSVGLGVALLLWKAPLTIFEKTIVVLSSGMVYYLPVVARNYALIPLFLFLIAHYYDKRGEHPYKYSLSLILLSQTHVLMLGLCSVLFVFYLIERIKDEKCVPAIVMLCINFVILLFYLLISYMSNSVVQAYSMKTTSMPTILYMFAYIYFKQSYVNVFLFNFFIFYGVMISFAMGLFKQDKKIFVCFISGFLYIFFIYTKVWFGGIQYQKAYLLLLVMLFCYWIIKEKTKLLKCSFAVLFVISCLISINVVNEEVKYNFSASKQLANYVKENIPDKDFKFLGYGFTISPISAYLPDRNFYYYNFLNEGYKLITYTDFRNLNAVDDKLLVPDTRYYIAQKEVALSKKNGYNLVYSTDEYVISHKTQAEVYRIYEKI